MATYLFHVKVIGKQGKTVRLALSIISAEQTAFPETEYFALMLLYDTPQKEGTAESPLSKEMVIDNLADEKWMDENVDRFIEHVSVTNIVNLPIKVDLRNLTPRQQNAFWESDAAPRAIMEITVTSERWLQHVTKGDAWKTSVSDPW
jgi:hypothetical protein